jgi:hypothetical protein
MHAEPQQRFHRDRLIRHPGESRGPCYVIYSGDLGEQLAPT